MVLTGGLMGVPGSDWKATAPKSLAGVRMLLTGSDVDDWIPEDSTLEAANLFRELGADVQMRIYKGRPHIVSEEEIEEARAFLNWIQTTAGVR
jgi:phospholipase/carboxylesterase